MGIASASTYATQNAVTAELSRRPRLIAWHFAIFFKSGSGTCEQIPTPKARAVLEDRLSSMAQFRHARQRLRQKMLRRTFRRSSGLTSPGIRPSMGHVLAPGRPRIPESRILRHRSAAQSPAWCSFKLIICHWWAFISKSGNSENKTGEHMSRSGRLFAHATRARCGFRHQSCSRLIARSVYGDSAGIRSSEVNWANIVNIAHLLPY